MYTSFKRGRWMVVEGSPYYRRGHVTHKREKKAVDERKSFSYLLNLWEKKKKNQPFFERMSSLKTVRCLPALCITYLTTHKVLKRHSYPFNAGEQKKHKDQLIISFKNRENMTSHLITPGTGERETGKFNITETVRQMKKQIKKRGQCILLENAPTRPLRGEGEKWTTRLLNGSSGVLSIQCYLLTNRNQHCSGLTVSSSVFFFFVFFFVFVFVFVFVFLFF